MPPANGPPTSKTPQRSTLRTRTTATATAIAAAQSPRPPRPKPTPDQLRDFTVSHTKSQAHKAWIADLKALWSRTDERFADLAWVEVDNDQQSANGDADCARNSMSTPPPPLSNSSTGETIWAHKGKSLRDHLRLSHFITLIFPLCHTQHSSSHAHQRRSRPTGLICRSLPRPYLPLQSSLPMAKPPQDAHPRPSFDLRHHRFVEVLSLLLASESHSDR